MLNVILSTTAIAVLIVFFPIKNTKITGIAFYCYLLAVLSLTLLTREDATYGQANLIPLERVVFWMKRYYQTYGLGRMFTPLFGFYLNILLFVPFGFLLHLPPRETIILGFLFSLAIEISQLISGLGMFETDDLITNTLGTWIGILAYRRRININASLR